MDDDDLPGGGGRAGTGPSGGAYPIGGTSSYGGNFPEGGAYPAGGTYPVGGAYPMGGAAYDGGTTSSGGIGATGGTGISNGGSVASGGTAGTAGSGTLDPECKGIKSNAPCAIDGKQCPYLLCGLADSGFRSCNCATNWTCTSCDYTNSPFRDRPLDIQQCPADAADEAPCLNPNTVCGPVGGEYCACYYDSLDGSLIWDCDSPPPTWASF